MTSTEAELEARARDGADLESKVRALTGLSSTLGSGGDEGHAWPQPSRLARCFGGCCPRWHK